ncbi:uncharacterized protein LOC127537604 isoform X2 [Acanthochromis polyacanthus]|uniref:uncharacterized protein LOC127537604 isoform X2 n=1 Tax=Acanthochromis polyacanthus TaxID=80966 RepID=UPI002234B7D7|nr:uncharacterized protein LOC127537604 isoform X2 [Acanthochromis polyacanthus]
MIVTVHLRSITANHLSAIALSGIHCEITTVNKVPVKAGDSISVPCLYEQKYEDHVKYLCKGNPWLFCQIVITTNQQPCSERFCISDDTIQRIFTVTINNVTDEDKVFWCAVERSGLLADVHQRFELSVTTVTPSLYVNQKEKITGHEGGSVTVLCHYNYPEVTRWCRLGSSCVTAQTGCIDGTTLEINASVPNVFNVTMSKLRTKSSGWYWCASEDLQMPVHLTVHELPSTTAAILIPNTTGTPSTTHQTSFLLTSTETHKAPAANATVNGTGSGSSQDEHQSVTIVIAVTTTLFLALVVVPAACFGCRMIMRNKSKPEVGDINVDYPDSDVTYTTIVHNQHAGAKTKDCIPVENVTYSTIVLKDSMQQMAEPADRSVIYSTIKHDEP